MVTRPKLFELILPFPESPRTKALPYVWESSKEEIDGNYSGVRVYTDCPSVLHNTHQIEDETSCPVRNDLGGNRHKIYLLQLQGDKMMLPRVSAYAGVPGNERADNLAKYGRAFTSPRTAASNHSDHSAMSMKLKAAMFTKQILLAMAFQTAQQGVELIVVTMR